jgi:hypothetical protein
VHGEDAYILPVLLLVFVSGESIEACSVEGFHPSPAIDKEPTGSAASDTGDASLRRPLLQGSACRERPAHGVVFWLLAGGAWVEAFEILPWRSWAVPPRNEAEDFPRTGRILVG